MIIKRYRKAIAATVALVIWLLPCGPSAVAKDTEWEYKVVSLMPLVRAWLTENRAGSPHPRETPPPDGKDDDLFSTMADLQKTLDAAYLPRLQAFLNEQGRDRWEMCGLADGIIIFKRPK
jgi:hypothetical protein